MSSLIEPNLHPLVVHFVVAFLLTSSAIYLALNFFPSTSKWRESLRSTADWMLGLGVIAAIAAVAAGLQAYYSVDHDAPSHAAMTVHRNWAIPTAGAFIALGLWRWRGRTKAPSLLFSLAMLIAAGALATTAWLGGRLVYEFGLGVSSLPQSTGDGHDHEHGAAPSGTDGVGDASDHAEDGHAHDETPPAAAPVENGHDSDGHAHSEPADASPSQTSDDHYADGHSHDEAPEEPQASEDVHPDDGHDH